MRACAPRHFKKQRLVALLALAGAALSEARCRVQLHQRVVTAASGCAGVLTQLRDEALAAVGQLAPLAALDDSGGVLQSLLHLGWDLNKSNPAPAQQLCRLKRQHTFP